MKKLLLLLFVVSSSVYAQNGVETDLAKLERLKIESELDSLKKITGEEALSKRGEKKVQYKFGGRVEGRMFYDSHKLIESRNGVLPGMPTAPNYDPNGNDLNQVNSLRFTVFSSRLNFGVNNIRLGKNGGVASAYIEGDFLGMADSYVQLFRLRHAYMRFTWERDELLIGQTNSLFSVEEAQPNTVDFAMKAFQIIHRAPQIRYKRKISSNVNFLVMAEFYNPSHIPVGPKDAQINACLPDLQAQFQFGDPSRVFGGITGGVKFLKPRTVTSDNYKSTKTVTSYSVNGFFKANIDSYTITLFGIYGSNLSGLGYIGGYGKLKDDLRSGDYGYANTYSAATWVDLETPFFNKFKFGFFAGYQQNLGSKKEMDLKKTNGAFDYGYFKDNDAVWVSGLAPRVFYNPIKSLLVGLEYAYTTAVWGKKFDNYYKATETFPKTSNNRIELLVRFSF